MSAAAKLNHTAAINELVYMSRSFSCKEIKFAYPWLPANTLFFKNLRQTVINYHSQFKHYVLKANCVPAKLLIRQGGDQIESWKGFIFWPKLYDNILDELVEKSRIQLYTWCRRQFNN
jgi:hypothetical protein